jgi:hypothetical protein
MNGLNTASSFGGGSAVLALFYACGVFGVIMVIAVLVLVLVVARRDFRWVLSDDDRTRRLVALRTGTALSAPGKSRASRSRSRRRLGRRWWSRKRPRGMPSARPVRARRPRRIRQ